MRKQEDFKIKNAPKADIEPEKTKALLEAEEILPETEVSLKDEESPEEGVREVEEVPPEISVEEEELPKVEESPKEVINTTKASSEEELLIKEESPEEETNEAGVEKKKSPPRIEPLVEKEGASEEISSKEALLKEVSSDEENTDGEKSDGVPNTSDLSAQDNEQKRTILKPEDAVSKESIENISNASPKSSSPHLSEKANRFLDSLSDISRRNSDALVSEYGTVDVDEDVFFDSVKKVTIESNPSENMESDSNVNVSKEEEASSEENKDSEPTNNGKLVEESATSELLVNDERPVSNLVDKAENTEESYISNVKSEDVEQVPSSVTEAYDVESDPKILDDAVEKIVESDLDNKEISEDGSEKTEKLSIDELRVSEDHTAEVQEGLKLVENINDSEANHLENENGQATPVDILKESDKAPARVSYRQMKLDEVQGHEDAIGSSDVPDSLKKSVVAHIDEDENKISSEVKEVEESEIESAVLKDDVPEEISEQSIEESLSKDEGQLVNASIGINSEVGGTFAEENKDEITTERSEVLPEPIFSIEEPSALHATDDGHHGVARYAKC
ncbi:hypothetical protein GQR58_008486 [Nymphon striatum]|nr:hypothetical protein GQR58_008486 [Nymphon striatum]